MLTKFLLQLRILPRWLIIVIDLLIVCFSTFVGYLLRFNFEFGIIFNFSFQWGVALNAFSTLVVLLFTRSYAGIVRYTGLKDGLRVFTTLVISHILTGFVNLIYYYNFDKNLIPYSVIFISLLASFVLLFQYRLLIKNIFSYYTKLYREKANVAIFGAGQMGIVTKHLLDDDVHSDSRVVAFVEDNKNKVGKNINGTSIYAFQTLEELITKYALRELVIAVNDLPVERKQEIVDFCLKRNLKVRRVPRFDTWVKGELSLKQIRNIRIEDLLERDSIELKNYEVALQLKGKVVCVTGAAGSIGSELVRQIVNYEPDKLILIDQAESALYELYRELISHEKLLSLFIADVTCKERIKAIFEESNPDIVYHAAAYKHVPLMEENPSEAIRCNILGTKHLADISMAGKVEKFVMVSTDKAVNPTNVMGASKRIAEMYIQSLSRQNNETAFITTRFGNVLGSNGSVIPYFKKQIDKGGPVTVTHPEVTRYFMTIPEACELILEAGCVGKNGQILLFDMGKSIKIADLAQKMIKLSGLRPFEDIDIVYTGLRQGEKLYEELLATQENTIATHHYKIMIAKVSVPDYNEVKTAIDTLDDLLRTNKKDIDLVSHMKKMIPEFKSNRSVYEKLDSSSEPLTSS